LKTSSAKTILFSILFGAVAGLTAFGISALLGSPYTGIRFEVRDGAALVSSVDQGSPAFEKLQEGDVLLDVYDLGISPAAFHADPDFVGTRNGLASFWEEAEKLSERIRKGLPADLTIRRAGSVLHVSITPGDFPLRAALTRAFPMFTAGWLYLAIGYLTLRKKAVDMSIANFINAYFVCACFVSLAATSSRDMALSYSDFRVLYTIGVASSVAFPLAFVHLMLVFPRKKKIFDKFPRMPYALYGVGLILVILHFAGAFRNTFITTYLPIVICTGVLLTSLIHGYFTERSSMHKKQIQWVALGVGASLVLWGGLTAIPMMSGRPFVSQDISLLFTLCHPLGLAFAITRYRLMDIESIFDHTIIYSVTILVLAGIETGFLSSVAPAVMKRGMTSHTAMLMAVLIIVFAYIPVRNTIKTAVERLFKRGEYDVNLEAERFYLRLDMQDGKTIVEKFASFARELLAASGAVVVKIESGGTAAVLYADGGAAAELSSVLISHAGRLWEYLRGGRPCRFGYEAPDSVLPDTIGRRTEFERSLFIAFPVEEERGDAGYLAMLLGKWNDLAYSKKDAVLMNAISTNVSGIIKAEELQREKSSMEAAFRKQRDEIAREMHDGLGNILTTIAVMAQVADRRFHKDPARAKDMLERIENYSREALDFMRTGLTVLDNPDATIGDLAARVQQRYEDMLSTGGVSLRTEARGDVRDIKPGAAVAISILRVIQEALSNAMKHSDAKKIVILFSRNADNLLVTIQDNGKGFDTTDDTKGMGLRSMRQRVEEIGGGFFVSSSSGGTEIRFTVPFKQYPIRHSSPSETEER
jgi:signal transduction histidine kinase